MASCAREIDGFIMVGGFITYLLESGRTLIVSLSIH